MKLEVNEKDLSANELLSRYKRNKISARRFLEENREEINRKGREKNKIRRETIDPETGLSVAQLNQKKYWANYKRNNPNWQKRRATYMKKYREENMDLIRLKDKLKAR